MHILVTVGKYLPIITNMEVSVVILFYAPSVQLGTPYSVGRFGKCLTVTCLGAVYMEVTPVHQALEKLLLFAALVFPHVKPPLAVAKESFAAGLWHPATDTNASHTQ